MDRFKRFSVIVLETVAESTIRALGKLTFDKSLKSISVWCAGDRKHVLVGPQKDVMSETTPVATETPTEQSVPAPSQQTLDPDRPYGRVEDGQQTSFSIRDVGVQTRGVWFYSSCSTTSSSLCSDNSLTFDVVVEEPRASIPRSSLASSEGSVGTQVEPRQLAESILQQEEDATAIVGNLPPLSPDEELLYEMDPEDRVNETVPKETLIDEDENDNNLKLETNNTSNDRKPPVGRLSNYDF